MKTADEEAGPWFLLNDSAVQELQRLFEQPQW